MCLSGRVEPNCEGEGARMLKMSGYIGANFILLTLWVFLQLTLHRATRHASHSLSGRDPFGAHKMKAHVCMHTPYSS
jgi:hypothetical protein